MSNDNTALALALGAGAGLGLWYLLRDDKEQESEDKTRPTPTSAPASTAPPAPTQAAPCSLRLDAKGLTSDGAAIDIPAAVAKCQAAGRADLVIADDAPSAAYADLGVAFSIAGIAISERRNARSRRRRSGRRQAARVQGHRDVAAFAMLAARVRSATKTRQGSKRQETAAKLARFVTKHSGARVNDDATVDFQGNVVVTGGPDEMRKVAAWVERLARDSGRRVSATIETFDDADDPDWAVCRIHGLGVEGA